MKNDGLTAGCTLGGVGRGVENILERTLMNLLEWVECKAIHSTHRSSFSLEKQEITFRP